jgi:hypothetical protein
VRHANLFHSLPFLAAICVVPLGLLPLLDYLAIARFGTSTPLTLQGCFLLPGFAAVLTLVVAPFLLFIHRYRRLAARCWLLAAVLTVATLVGLRLGARVRTAAFHDLAQRSVPLVEAIHAHEAKHGAPPPDLAALVPEFLPSVPGTGIAAYPNYEYFVGTEAAKYDNNPWALRVFTPGGGINFDMFVYFPLQNYPEFGYGGRLERIADWAYVHE